MKHQSINAKYTKDLERLYKADRKYCELVDKHQAIIEEIEYGTARYFRVEERQAIKECDMYEDFRERFVDHLPERELKAWAKRYESFHGYAPYLV